MRSMPIVFNIKIALMQMSVETPPLTYMDSFNFEKAFEHWCGMKARKSHRPACTD